MRGSKRPLDDLGADIRVCGFVGANRPILWSHTPNHGLVLVRTNTQEE
jgi:hypothetical protein